jgi:aldose 1-epimerase
MNHEALLTLTSGKLELVLAPAAGCSTIRFDYRLGDQKIAVFRGCDGVPPSPVDTANFPLVPYVNRIRGGRFNFRGREVTIAQNLKGDASPLHGQGWLAPWDVVSAGESEADLRFRHEAGEWPWSYEARQLFTLDPRGLSILLACRNLSDEPMPCGLGQHPYFPCTAETVLDTRVTHVWTIDENVLPVEKVPATGRFDLAERRVCGQDLDHGFAGWGGTARIETAGSPLRVEISSPDAHFFQVYSPPSGGFFVAEPVSHANAALNEPEEQWAELGMRVLEPGEEMSLSARFEVTPL